MLLDEIDKAEPDLPNDLLEPLDRRSFRVTNGPLVRAGEDLKILTLITTNGERELPPAFLRRCVSLVLQEPDEAKLCEIAACHYPRIKKKRVRGIAAKIVALRAQAIEQGRRPPGTSEFLDAVEACERLKIGVGHAIWTHVEQAVLVKNLTVSGES